MPATVEDLGKLVKQKHPGQYDDMADADVGAKVKAKFPGSYDDFTDAPKIPGMEKLGALPKAGNAPPKPNELSGPPRENPGFMDSIWSGLKSGPLNLAATGNGLINMISHPVDTVNEWGGQNSRLAQGAIDAAKKGDYINAARKSTNYLLNMVPGLGAASDEAGEEFANGNLAGGAGKTLALGINTVAGLKTPQLAEGAANLITPGAESGVKNLFKTDPRVGITRALRPVPSDPSFNERIPETLRAVRQANPEMTPNQLASVKNGQPQVIPAFNKTIDLYQQALEPWLNRAKGRPISGQPIVDATKRATSGMLESEQPAGDALVRRAIEDYHEFTPVELRERLALLNQRLHSFYSKSPSAQSSALADIPESILKAQRDAVADTLYKHLDPTGEGAGPRAIQARTGDLIDMRDAAMRRKNALVAEQPLTPIGHAMSFLDPVIGPVRDFIKGRPGSGLSFAEGQEGRSEPLIRRSFKSAGNGPVNALPQPGEEYYPTGDINRLLTEGSIKMPEVTPTQGTMQGPGPHMGAGIAPNTGTRTLTGKTMTPQGGFAAGTTNDLVPWKNPTTGEIEYVPKRFLDGSGGGPTPKLNGGLYKGNPR